MKIFKLLTTTLLVVLCIGFVSCSKGDEPTSLIVGKWEEVKDNPYRLSLTFKNDGTYILEERGKESDPSYGSYTFFDNSNLKGIIKSNETDSDKQTFELIKNKFNEEILVITSYTSSSTYKDEYSRVK